MPNPEQNLALVQASAMRAGFARAGTLALPGLAGERAFADWLDRGWAGGMSYLRRHAPARLAPHQLVPGSRSVICLAASCGGGGPGPIARYARGRDYHKVLKKRCRALMDLLRAARPEFDG
ncbi:MAG: DUF1730 domain-containing protein, partial [Planctomycetota bacterium]|nr:DUF1730 domain-containing protein [Planctomycetota bacterium]